NGAKHEHHQIAACKIKTFEESDIHNGFLVAPLPDNKGHQTHGGKNDQRGNELRPEPVVLLSFVERNLESAYTDGEQTKPDIVEPRHGSFHTGYVGRIFD